MSVIILVWLSALEVFVLPIVALACVVSRPTIPAGVLVKAGAGLAVSMIVDTAVAMLLGLFSSA